MFKNMFRLIPLLALIPFGFCVEGDAGGTGAGGGGGTGDGGAGANGGAGNTADKKYSDADLNRLLAEDRRRNQGSSTKQTQTLQAELEAILNATDVNALPENSAIRKTLDGLHSNLLSEQDQNKKAQAKLDKALKDALDNASKSDGKYKSLKTGRALLDAALPVAATPGAADIIAERLQKYALLDDQENVVIEMEVTTDGIKEKKKISPAEAVKVMEGQVDLYGTLFKSGVGAGVGGKNDAAKGSDGEIDMSKLTWEQLQKLAKDSPEKIGLRR